MTVKFKDVRGRVPFDRIEFWDPKSKCIFFIDYHPVENLDEYSDLEFVDVHIDGNRVPVLMLQCNTKDDFKHVNNVEKGYEEFQKKMARYYLEREAMLNRN